MVMIYGFLYITADANYTPCNFTSSLVYSQQKETSYLPYTFHVQAWRTRAAYVSASRPAACFLHGRSRGLCAQDECRCKLATSFGSTLSMFSAEYQVCRATNANRCRSIHTRRVWGVSLLPLSAPTTLWRRGLARVCG